MRSLSTIIRVVAPHLVQSTLTPLRTSRRAFSPQKGHGFSSIIVCTSIYPHASSSAPQIFSLTMQLQLPLQHISYAGRISVKRPSNPRKTATVEPHFACLCFINFRPHPNHFWLSQVFGYVPNGLHAATHLLSNICSAHTVLIHAANMLLFFGVQPIRFAGFAITGFQMPHACKMGR